MPRGKLLTTLGDGGLRDCRHARLHVYLDELEAGCGREMAKKIDCTSVTVGVLASRTYLNDLSSDQSRQLGQSGLGRLLLLWVCSHLI